MFDFEQFGVIDNENSFSKKILSLFKKRRLNFDVKQFVHCQDNLPQSTSINNDIIEHLLSNKYKTFVVQEIKHMYHDIKKIGNYNNNNNSNNAMTIKTMKKRDFCEYFSQFSKKKHVVLDVTSFLSLFFIEIGAFWDVWDIWNDAKQESQNSSAANQLSLDTRFQEYNNLGIVDNWMVDDEKDSLYHIGAITHSPKMLDILLKYDSDVTKYQNQNNQVL